MLLDYLNRFSRALFVRRLMFMLAISLNSFLALPVSGQVAGGGNEPDKEQQRRETVKQEFIRKHSDSSGRIRPDLWRKGMEHASQMSIAPSIGAVKRWKQIGPAPIRDPGKGQISAPGGTLSGLVTDIAIDPSGTTDTIIYIATDAGVPRVPFQKSRARS